MVLLLSQRKRQNWVPKVKGRWKKLEETIGSGGSGIENKERRRCRRSVRLTSHFSLNLVPLLSTVSSEDEWKQWLSLGPWKSPYVPSNNDKRGWPHMGQAGSLDLVSSSKTVTLSPPQTPLAPLWKNHGEFCAGFYDRAVRFNQRTKRIS